MIKLSTANGFGLLKIVKKMNLKEELRELSKKTNKKKDSIENVQLEIAFLIIDHIPDAEQEIYKFLGKLSDKTPEQISEQPLADTIEMIKEMCTQENFGSFLSTALK